VFNNIKVTLHYSAYMCTSGEKVCILDEGERLQSVSHSYMQGWAINLARGPLGKGRIKQRVILSDAVFLNRFWFVTPFGIFTQPVTPFLSFV